MIRPTFTVVMPAHDAETTIGSAIRSVLGQTRQDFELIVVDDGSTDQTRARLEPFLAEPRLRLVSQPQRGPAAARNAAIRVGSAPLVSMLDADDLWLPRYLERMAEALAADTAAGLAYTDAWILEEPPGRVRRRPALWREPDAPPASARELMLKLAGRNFIYTSATVRRSVLDELGGFDERFWHAEDLELWLRIATAGYRAARAAGILAVHRDHEASLTGRTEPALARALASYATIASEHPDPTVRRIVAERERALSRTLQRLTHPTVSQRVETALRRRYSSWRGRSQWLAEPPEEVAQVLAMASG